MPDVKHAQRNAQDARKDRGADQGKDLKLGVGKAATEDDARKAAKDFRQNTTQRNGSAADVVKDQNSNLKNYAESQGAFKKAPAQEQKDLTKDLEQYAGRQQEHQAARQDATDRIADTAQKAVDDLSKDKRPDQTLWADAKKILQETRAAVDAMLAKDDARQREARSSIMTAAAKPADLSTQLKDDAKNAPSRPASIASGSVSQTYSPPFGIVQRTSGANSPRYRSSAPSIASRLRRYAAARTATWRS